MTEKEKFLAWHKGQTEKGMIRFHPSFNFESQEKPTSEELYGELNRMIESPAVEDDRFL